MMAPMTYYSDDDRMENWLLRVIRDDDAFAYWLEVWRFLHYGFEVLARGEEP